MSGAGKLLVGQRVWVAEGLPAGTGGLRRYLWSLSVTLDVGRLAVRAATAISRTSPDQWSVLVRVHVDRLLDHLEARHEPAVVDAAVERFVEALRVRLAGGSGAG